MMRRVQMSETAYKMIEERVQAAIHMAERQRSEIETRMFQHKDDAELDRLLPLHSYLSGQIKGLTEAMRGVSHHMGYDSDMITASQPVSWWAEDAKRTLAIRLSEGETSRLDSEGAAYHLGYSNGMQQVYLLTC